MGVRDFEWIKGYVRCSIEGKYIEIFINQAVSKGLNLWNFKMVNNNHAEFSIELKDFFKLKPILKKSFSRIHIIKKVGLPFLLNKFYKRKGIILGMLIFILLIQLLTSIVWTVNIEGNNKLKQEEIYQVLNEIGIHEGMFKFKLPEQELIQNKLLNQLDDIAWVGIKLSGTRLDVTIVEKVKPEQRKSTQPSNIIATKDAIIYKILAEKGLPKVKVNDRVKEGDILISGVLGNENNQELVNAEGEVLGVVWYESKIVMPLKQEWREYTGNYIERKYISLKFGNRMLKYKGKSEISYEKYQSIYSWQGLTWRNYQLPLIFTTEKVLEYEERERILTEEEAIKIALEQTKLDLFSKIDVDSKIISEKVLHQAVENGKLTIKVLYEVLEDIAVEHQIEIYQGE